MFHVPTTHHLQQCIYKNGTRNWIQATITKTQTTPLANLNLHKQRNDNNKSWWKPRW